MVTKSFFCTIWLDLFHMCISIFNRTICYDQISCRFFTDSRHTRNIIRSITHQCLQFNDLRRIHLISFLHVSRIIIFNLCGSSFGLWHPDQHIVRCQLQQIPVTRYNNSVDSFFLTDSRRRSKEIISLKSFFHQKRNTHSLQNFL